MAYPFVQARYDYGPRTWLVRAFLVHMAEGGGTVGYLARDPARGVSVHYVIEDTGRIVQMLQESHASGSVNPDEIRTTDDPDGFYGVTAAKAVMGAAWNDPNAAVISVEIEGYAVVGPKPAQAAALADLARDVRSRYPGIGNLGHRDFAGYKACPGRHIDWPALGGHGAGGDMATFGVIPDPKLAAIKTGAQLYDLGLQPLVKVSIISAAPSPYAHSAAGATYRVVEIVSGGVRQLALAHVTDCTLSPVTPSVVSCDDVVISELDAAADRAAVAVRARP